MDETISALYDIQWHLGDNYHSDVMMAHKHNVPGIHSTIHAITASEEIFCSHGNAGSSFALLLLRLFQFI